MIASQRFPASQQPGTSMMRCASQKKSFCGFSTSDVGLYLVQSGVHTRRATKATQNVRCFPQEVTCGTNEAFAQNSTRDCACKLVAPNVI